MKIKFLLTTLVLFSCCISAFSQTEEADVKAVIISLFDGMRAKNSEQILNAFSADAIMQTIQDKPEGTTIGSNSVADFAKSIGSVPEGTSLDERITDYQINVDGNMATAWTPYQFYLNGNFSHCGVNSFQLVKLEGKWKIVYIIDTRRKEACIE
ncbi:nuclear transport factor 2 family protein [Algoriphagus pacificus]|uniref:Nuclear transport factor 2 family protein n=1 Tax=Algoriphagus pacificus TaxID=2811234 RepID=A0ABS3CHC0_9BACT|nr:nuclear transport factor 2 family protein [Algoriphagus pacificus]MBN7815034.1 nuclear transport factor 2 family protein [Algoriphagus pacificus]